MLLVTTRALCIKKMRHRHCGWGRHFFSLRVGEVSQCSQWIGAAAVVSTICAAQCNSKHMLERTHVSRTFDDKTICARWPPLRRRSRSWEESLRPQKIQKIQGVQEATTLGSTTRAGVAGVFYILLRSSSSIKVWTSTTAVATIMKEYDTLNIQIKFDFILQHAAQQSRWPDARVLRRECWRWAGKPASQKT